MNRKSLIVLNAGSGDDFCSGVKVDGEKMKAFLMSAKGGAWNSDEIEILDFTNYVPINGISPKARLLERLQQIRFSDYAFVLFSGHGRMNHHDETFFGLSNGNEITDAEIKLLLPTKSTLIMDCCRKKPKAQDVVEAANSRNFSKIAEDSEYEKRRLRLKFDRFVGEASTAPVYIYSCAPNQYSRDTNEGGLFAKNFIKSAKDSVQDLTVVGTFNLAHPKVINENHAQTPHITMVRTGPYFPFAVV